MQQKSDTFLLSALLSFSGGFQDAYTYFVRDHVFANAQTGNIILMSHSIMLGNFMAALKYMFPIIAFACGVLLADQIEYRFKHHQSVHWRQRIVLVEIVIMFFVGLLNHHFDLFATTLVSFSCALQVQAFRKVNGYQYASTMCIGNLRSGTESLSKFLSTKDKIFLTKCLHYYGVIFVFACGAVCGGILSVAFGLGSIMVCCFVLAICYWIMQMK